VGLNQGLEGRVSRVKADKTKRLALMCASITIPVHGLGFEVYLAGFRGVGKNPFLLSYSDFRESFLSRKKRPSPALSFSGKPSVLYGPIRPIRGNPRPRGPPGRINPLR
jgi:hypothetical protein